MKKNFSNRFILIILFAMILFVTGCSSNTKTEPQDENVTTIETVLEHSFTGPGQDLIDIWEEIEKTGSELAEENIEISLVPLYDYSNERFQPYFTEDGYQQYVSEFGFSFLRTAYWNDYQLDIDHINIETSEVKDNIYNFSLDVQYQKEDSDKQVVNVTGEANLNEDGQIVNMIIRGKDIMEGIAE